MGTYLGEYLPKVLTRVQYMQDDISENPCEACGKFAEQHTWVLINHERTKVIFCSESQHFTANQVDHTIIGGNAGKVYV